MPGPDDTMRFLEKYATKKGYSIPEDIDPALLGKIKDEAEAMRHARRGLDTLLNVHCIPLQPVTHSPRATSVDDPDFGRFRSIRGTQ